MSFKIYPEKKLIVTRFIGPIVYQDVLNWVDELTRNEFYSKEYDGIVDLRKAIFTDPDPQKAQALSTYMIEHDFIQGKLVMLVDKPTETALVMIHCRKEGKKHPTEVFSTVQAAASFLERDPDFIESLIGD